MCCFRSKSTNKQLYLKAIGVLVRLQRQLALVLSNLEANQAQFPISFWWFWNSDLVLVVRVATRSAQKSRTSTRNPHMRPLRQHKQRNTTQGAQTRGLASFRGPRLHNPPLPTCPQSRGSSLDRTPSGPLADSTQPPGPLPSLLITTGADTFDRKPPRVAAVMCSGITVNHPTVPRSTPFGSKQYGKMAPSEPFAPVSTFQPCRLPAMSWSQL